MPRADNFISSLFATGANKSSIKSKVLTPFEAASLSSSLRADAADFYYSSWVSFLDAVRGINLEFYTWSKIKLYYCTFYALRASLAVSDICIFHIGKSQYLVTAQPGACPISCADRGTHKAVMKGFQRHNPGHPLVSQQIDLQDAVDWLIEIRERANYQEPRFAEPDCGAEFKYALKNGLRQSVNAYLAEPSFAYVFDPDHAMIAYPLRALTMLGSELAAIVPLGAAPDEQKFLKENARDKSGALPMLLTEMRRLGVVT